MSMLRIVSAVLITILLMPCMGFFVFGFMASREYPPMEALPWQIGYGLLELGAIACVIAAWWFALRKVPGANTCVACGFSLEKNTSGQCPECGSSIRRQTGS